MRWCACPCVLRELVCWFPEAVEGRRRGEPAARASATDRGVRSPPTFLFLSVSDRAHWLVVCWWCVWFACPSPFERFRVVEPS